MLGRTVAAIQEGVVDFEGQQFIQSSLFYISAIGTLLGFLFGFLTESFQNCCLSMGITAIIAAVVCIPSWPIYKKHQINWAPHDREKIARLYAAKDGAPEAMQKNKKAVSPVKENSSKSKKNGGSDSRKRK